MVLVPENTLERLRQRQQLLTPLGKWDKLDKLGY